MAEVYANTDSFIAHMPGVKAAVSTEAEMRAARIRSVAATHQDTGRFLASIQTETGATDTIIYSDDPAALSINYGHTAANGRRVEGIHAFEAGLT